ncbi:MAG: hypothetical protein U0325_04075 [Polyangiales bacterium]
MRALLPLALVACAARNAPATVTPGCAEPVVAQRVARRPRPLDPALPTLRVENLRFADVAVCATGRCAAQGQAPAAPVAEDGATTPPPALVWVQVIRPGASVVVPAAAHTDLLGVTLVGELSLERAAAPQVAPVRAGAWTAFLAPDGDAVLRCVGESPAAAVLVTARGDGPVADRGADVETVDLVAAQDLAWAGGAVHARIAFEGPRSPRASLGVLLASDDAPVAEHVHDRAWEVLAALGRGAAARARAVGARRRRAPGGPRPHRHRREHRVRARGGAPRVGPRRHPAAHRRAGLRARGARAALSRPGRRRARRTPLIPWDRP